MAKLVLDMAMSLELHIVPVLLGQGRRLFDHSAPTTSNSN